MENSSAKQTNSELDELLKSEEEKLLSSIKRKEENSEQKGISQIIGRRMGYFWEEACTIVLKNSSTEDLSNVILEIDTIIDLIEKNSDGMSEESKDKLRESIQILNEIDIVREGEELADLSINHNENKYAIQFKWRFRSNDAKTVRQIANSAKILKELGYKPIMLIRKPYEKNLDTPLTRFEKAGWELKCGEESVEFIENISDFEFKDWVDKNVDFWNLLSNQQEYLNSVGWEKEELKF